jgi:hypothetical protein
MTLLNPEALAGIGMFNDIMGIKPIRPKNRKQRLVAGRKKGEDTLEILEESIELLSELIESYKELLQDDTTEETYTSKFKKIQEFHVYLNSLKLLKWCYTHNLWLGSLISYQSTRVNIIGLWIDGTGTIRLTVENLRCIKANISINPDSMLPFKVR